MIVLKLLIVNMDIQTVLASIIETVPFLPTSEEILEKERLAEEERKSFLAEVKPDLREWQWQFINSEKPSPYRYGVINGSRVPSDLVEYVNVPPRTKEVAIGSDGYRADIFSPSMEETHRKYHVAIRSEKNFVVDDLTYLRLRRQVS